jgi:catalase
MSISPRQSIDVANEVFGRHPHYRALHAKGTLCRATFTPTPEAAKLTTASHMQGEPIPATVRVSNGGGDPDVPDYKPDVRGLAVKLYLRDGSRTDIVAQSVPRFPVRTPEAFAELMLAQRPGAAMAWRLPLFVARYPRTLRTLPPGLPALRPIASYATCSYYATHAFRFIDAAGGVRYIRYKFAPEAGDERLSPREAKRRGRDYLQQDIAERLATGPVRFALELQLAEPGDRVDDASSVWPRERQRVRAGMLELTQIETERETGDDVLVFDPTRITEGIELSEDPILQFRHLAYTESVARRMES